MKYGRLTLLEPEQRWIDEVECRCDCGRVVYVRLGHLKTGSTQSCGCLRKEMAKKLWLFKKERRKENEALH